MAQRPIGGITGVLGELIAPSAVAAASPRPEQPSHADRHFDPVAVREWQTVGGPRRARLGRPQGRSVRHAGPKEKVTLRIDSGLIAEYRDWSWEARCQLGELVERALTAYRESCRNRR